MKIKLVIALMTLISVSSFADTEFQKEILLQVSGELELLEHLVEKAELASTPGSEAKFEFQELRSDLIEQSRAIKSYISGRKNVEQKIAPLFLNINSYVKRK